MHFVENPFCHTELVEVFVTLSLACPEEFEGSKCRQNADDLIS